VVDRIDLRLKLEDVFRVAQMRAQAFGHFGQRFERARIDARVGLDYRVAFVGDVEPYAAVIRVNNGFDRVANVVASVSRLRIRITVAGGIRVSDPEQSPFVNDHIRIVVELQVWRDLREPLADIAVEQDAAVRRQIVRQHELQIAESDGEEQLPQPRSD